MALGPIMGGILLEYVDWRAVFWINVPICALAVLLTAIFVPESKSVTMRHVDLIGLVLGMAFLFGLVFVLIEGPGMGWTDTRVVVSCCLAALAFATFLRYESRRLDPFVELRFFRSIPFASATAIAVCAFAAWGGAFLFMMSIYLQGERGLSAVNTGLMFLPVAVGAFIFSPLSGRLVGAIWCQTVADDRRRIDRRRDSHVRADERRYPAMANAGRLCGFRRRYFDGERTGHNRGRQRYADRPRRCGGGYHIHEPTGGRRHRCGDMRPGRWCGIGRHQRRFRGLRPAPMASVRWSWCADLHARCLLDVEARAALSRASGAADRRNRSATGGCRCRVIRKRTRSGAR